MQQADVSVSEFRISPRLREHLARAVSLAEYGGSSFVMYVNGRQEKRTAWYSDPKRTDRALAVMRRKYGNGIIYVD